MNKFIIAAIISIASFNSFALDNSQRSEIFTVISDLESAMTKTDQDTIHNEIFYSKEDILKERMVKAIYNCETSFENHNSIDIDDLRVSLYRKSSMELVAYAKQSNCYKKLQSK